MTCVIRLDTGEKIVFYPDNTAYMFAPYGTFRVSIQKVTRDYIFLEATNNKLRVIIPIEKEGFKCLKERERK